MGEPVPAVKLMHLWTRSWCRFRRGSATPGQCAPMTPRSSVGHRSRGPLIRDSRPRHDLVVVRFDPFQEYLQGVRALPWVEPEDVPGLLRRARVGDPEARQRLIEGHLELTALLAWNLRPVWLAPVDAVQEANLILVRLVEDPACATPGAEIAAALDDFFRNMPQP